MYYSTTYDSPVGTLTLASNGTEIVGLWLTGQKYHGGSIPEEMTPNDELAVFDAARLWLDRYFAQKNPDISEVPLAPLGSEFRQAVWGMLREIPYGEVVTYGDIARIMAERRGKDRMSSQAVGGAVGHNPVSIIIPCHRVVGSDGSLTGYAGGVNKKKWLLELEGVDTSRFYIPTKGTAL